MKNNYTTPSTEVLLLRMEETICGISGGETYTPKPGTLDPDSD